MAEWRAAYACLFVGALAVRWQLCFTPRIKSEARFRTPREIRRNGSKWRAAVTVTRWNRSDFSIPRLRGLNGALSELQLTQAAFGEMAIEIDAAALLTYRAAWRRDVQKLPTTREAAMAKMAATESAHRVIDRAAQMFGGRGVMRGEIVESLYREIRALRIYEGATEVQKLIVARELLRTR